jgi:hypothetical protein
VTKLPFFPYHVCSFHLEQWQSLGTTETEKRERIQREGEQEKETHSLHALPEYTVVIWGLTERKTRRPKKGSGTERKMRGALGVCGGVCL